MPLSTEIPAPVRQVTYLLVNNNLAAFSMSVVIASSPKFQTPNTKFQGKYNKLK
jgi:hypothetical protein